MIVLCGEQICIFISSYFIGCECFIASLANYDYVQYVGIIRNTAPGGNAVCPSHMQSLYRTYKACFTKSLIDCTVANNVFCLVHCCTRARDCLWFLFVAASFIHLHIYLFHMLVYLLCQSTTFTSVHL